MHVIWCWQVIVSGIVSNKKVAKLIFFFFITKIKLIYLAKLLVCVNITHIWYINNRNISNIHLFDDGLHVLELAGPVKPGGSGGP